ncbi:MAG: DUF3553 domain-containing protein [Pseudomonadota bacterium]
MSDLSSILEPGMLVRHPEQPAWGLGQVQSNVGGKVTVNFEHEGKVVIDSTHVDLTLVFET